MNLPFIEGEYDLYIWAILAAVTAVSVWAGSRGRGRKIGSTIIVIILGFILGNIGVLPSESDTYRTIWGEFVPLAIPLLLLQADINKIIRESGPTLLAFLIGAAGTILGALLAFVFVALPAHAADLTGIFAATFIGGGMNFVAVSQSVGLTDVSLLLAATAADNILTVLFLFVLAMLPAVAFFAKNYTQGNHDGGGTSPESRKKPTLPEALWALPALGISLVLVMAGRYAQDMFGWGGTAILITTTLTVAVATLAPELCHRMKRGYDLGMILMLVFFASLGASANVQALIETAPILLLFAFIVVGVHFAFIFGIGKFTKLTLPELIIGSNACILGPPTAAALAAAKGWNSLVTPGILVGILGYAIGNFIGVGLARFLA